MDSDNTFNQRFSRKRVGSVKELCVNEFGIDISRLKTGNKGEGDPVFVVNS